MFAEQRVADGYILPALMGVNLATLLAHHGVYLRFGINEDFLRTFSQLTGFLLLHRRRKYGRRLYDSFEFTLVKTDSTSNFFIQFSILGQCGWIQPR